MEFFIVHHRTTPLMRLSLPVFTKTDRPPSWKKQIINIAFLNIKHLQWGAHHNSDVSQGRWNAVPATDMLRVSPAECSLNPGLAQRGPEGGGRSEGGRKGKVWDEMKKNDDQGPAAQLCVTVLTWPRERLSCVHLACTVLWQFERFYTKVEISGFSRDSVSIGPTRPAHLHGNTIVWKWGAAAPLKQTRTLQLEAARTPSRPPIIVLYPVRITHLCCQRGLRRHLRWGRLA